MLIDCPHCGTRGHAEFTFGRVADPPRPPDGPEWSEDWQRYVYERANPRGVQAEYWQHSGGCRLWLRLERDTASHAILSVRAAP